MQISASALVFEYRFLRKLRKMVSTARTLTAQAMMNDKRDGLNVAAEFAARADIGLRMAGLGLGAAATTITIGLTQSASSTTLLLGAGLASTALAGLLWLKRADNLLNPFLAFSGTWIAGLAYLAASHPVSAACAMAVSLPTLATTQLGGTRSLPVSQSPECEQAQPSAEQPDIGLELNGSGKVQASASIQDLNLLEGEQFVDRVHVADRVAFLRAISQLRNAELSELELELRLNKASKLQKERYGAYNLHLRLRESSVYIRPTANEQSQAEPDLPVIEAEADKHFLAIVSHELRTPLNAIIGFSDVLRGDENGVLPEKTRAEYIDLIHGAGTHLLSLVNTILDVSKIESGTYTIHRDEFDFQQTARDCIAMLGPQAKQKNITINDRTNCGSSMVNGDRRALKQVLINLLSNAIKYTDKNGFVTVDAAIGPEGLILEVSDTGVGMCADDLAKVGRPFAQLDNSMTRSNEGTGLGLALVRGLVDLHNGKMEIFSKVGVGTNVKIEIPNSVAPQSKGAPLPPRSSPHFDSLLRHDGGSIRENSGKEMGNEKRQAG